MIRHTIFIVFIFISFHGFGQKIYELSLNDAVNLALKNSEEIKNLVIDEQIQVAKNKEVTSSVYPQISASGQGTYYTNVPQVVFPSTNIDIYQVLNKEGVVDRNGQVISTDRAEFSSNAFSFIAPLNFQIGLSVNQLLFQPDIFVAFQAKQAVVDFAKANTEVAQVKVRDAVYKAYYQVLIAEDQKKVLVETNQRINKLHSDMVAMYKAGFAEQLDIDKLQVTKNNTTTAINQLNNGISISYSVLKTTLGLTQMDSIVLTDKLNIQELRAELLNKPDNFNYELRKEIGLLNIGKKLQELDMKRYEMSIYPTVAAFYNIQRSGQRNATLTPDDPWFWFTTGLVGISVNQPIFSGFLRKHKLEQSKLSITKLENTMNMTKRYIDMEQSVAYQSLKNALLNLDVQEANMKLAEDVFNTTKKKYEAGIGSSFELIQSDTELQRAQGSYFQALYDGYVARTNYYKSLGKI
jgi:outer membrane protein TolC